MAAITKPFTSIADAAIDPDSPITVGLLTAYRDRDQFLQEWLGASFVAGAVQDHDHDGVNSVLVPVGPSYLRNGSFESGEAGWTFNDFTGGSHAIETANDIHGAQSLAITSTVLANGGGEAMSNAFIPVAAGLHDIQYFFFYKASVVNISSRVEIIWYDDAQAQISASQALNTAATPTAASSVNATVIPPATARFMRVRLTGGVPALGSAVGTIYFDGVRISEWFAAPPNAIVLSNMAANSVGQSQIVAASVGQSEVKTTTAASSLSIASGGFGSIALAGGTYSISTVSAENVTGGVMGFGGGNTAAGVWGFKNPGGVAWTVYVDERYFQASPPYDLGDGLVRHFVYVMLDAAGNVIGTQIADDPTWAHHSPINIKSATYERAMVGTQTLEAALADPLMRDDVLNGVSPIIKQRLPITQQVRDQVMSDFAHPFMGNDMTGKSVVLLDPVSDFVGRLSEIAKISHPRDVRDMITAGHIVIDNVPLPRKMPGNVQAVAARMKNSRP